MSLKSLPLNTGLQAEAGLSGSAGHQSIKPSVIASLSQKGSPSISKVCDPKPAIPHAGTAPAGRARAKNTNRAPNKDSKGNTVRTLPSEHRRDGVVSSQCMWDLSIDFRVGQRCRFPVRPEGFADPKMTIETPPSRHECHLLRDSEKMGGLFHGARKE